MNTMIKKVILNVDSVIKMVSTNCFNSSYYITLKHKKSYAT